MAQSYLRTLVTVLFGLLVGLSYGQETREVKKTVPLSADGRVSIDTYKGSVTVTTWEKGEIEIFARIESDDHGRYAEERIRDTEVRIDATPTSVRIKSEYDKVRRHHGGFWGIFDGDWGSLPLVHYTIKMPRTAQLRIKDYKSEIKVSDLKSNADIETYKGRVDVLNLDGSLTLETYKGEVWADFVNLNARSSFETYKGEIEVKLPKGKGFELDADIGRRGRFDSDFDLERRTASRRDREYDYRGPVNGGGPTVSLKTSKGTIRLAQR
ncbi:MAG TPA: hypothetical protein DCP63_08525 [Bacteroidetes bacterium]|nr:hypothetical protein [Bacteroidota bacterium]